MKRGAAESFGCGLGRVILAVVSGASCLALGMTGAIGQQDPGRGETVTDRVRPELDPLGVRTGGFLFFPRLGIAEQYDDNIFATDTGEIDDYITVVSPALQLRSNWNTHELNFIATADAAYYRENTSEDYTDFTIGANGRVDVSRDTSIRLKILYLGLHEDRGSVDDANGVEPTTYTVLSPDLVFEHRFGRFSLQAAGKLKRFDYDDVVTSIPTVINNGDRDRDEQEGTLRTGFEVFPGYEMFIRGTYFDRAYEERTDDNGFQRSSKGYEAVVGAEFDFTGITIGEAFFGYRSQKWDDPVFDKIEGPQYGGEIVWNPSGLTTITGTVQRTIEETTLSNASGYFATRFGLSIDHELLRSLILGIGASHLNNNYEQILRDDNIIDSNLYAKYLMNRNFYLSILYNYTNRDSNVAGENYTRNKVMLRLQAQY